MTPFGAQCDDFHLATRLFLKLDLGLERETVLHFFDSVRREFPEMRKLRRRDDGSLLLEEGDADDHPRRWLRIDSSSLRTGYQNPPNPSQADRLNEVVLKMAPFHLTLGELDYDRLEVVYGFDLDYRGNHDELVAETLFAEGPLAGILSHSSAMHVIDAQPFLGVTVSENCETQIYLEIKSRTSTYEIRTQQYESQHLSVYLTARRYWGFSPSQSLIDIYHQLDSLAQDWATSKIAPLIVNPLAFAIASRP